MATKFGHQFHADRASRPGADPGSARTDHWTPTEVVAQLEASLRALRTDCIDIYQSHGGSDAEFATPGLWEALSRQVLAGKIRFLGVSLDPADAARAARVPTVGADVVQVTYNRLNRSAEDSVFPAAVDQRLGVRAREPSWCAGPRAAGQWPSEREIPPRQLDHRCGRLALVAIRRRRRRTAPRGRADRGDRSPGWRAARTMGTGLVPTASGCQRGDPGQQTVAQLEGNVAAAALEVMSPAHPLAVAP